MKLPPLSEALIRQHASDASYQRGRAYYQRGAVRSVVQRGQHLHAEVEGSHPWPYQVDITFQEKGIAEARCTCPYDWGGWCKHIVATLLTCLYHPEQIEERPPVAELLADLDREALHTLLVRLSEQRPDLAEAIEIEVERLHISPTTPPSPKERPQRKTAVDGAVFRRRVVAILHSLDGMRPSEAYWYVDGVVNEIARLLDQAWEFIEAGDGRNALIILEAITDEYVQNWFTLDDSNGAVSGFFYNLGPAWTEALLSANLTSEERRTWADRLTQWQNEIEDYGVEPVFAPAIAAALQGWDEPRLRRVLAGEAAPLWENEPPWFAEELIKARLDVLARQERLQEYLNLAQAAGQTIAYLTMRVQLGHTQQAFEQALRDLATAREALTLAQAFQDQGAHEEALRLGEHGLTLEDPDHQKAALARWLRDAAHSAGEQELALNAALVAFREAPSLEDYLAVQALAGDRWPEIRGELLEHLRRGSYLPKAKVEVFLHEGLIDDAIAAVQGCSNAHLLEKVADAAITSRPDWAIQTSRKQAEAIMDAAKAQHYDRAVQWLQKARTAYHAAGRAAEWQAYLDTLLQRHARKYKLVPMLQTLR